MSSHIVAKNVVEYFHWIIKATNILVIGSIVLSIIGIAAAVFGLTPIIGAITLSILALATAFFGLLPRAF